MATAPTFSIPFVDTPAFYSGTAQTNVVPSVYPVAINGRPYLIDMKSGRYVRSHEQRVRDSQDNSTAPGEAAINPGGLWRRGQDSWHLGAGQKYADTAEAKDYMFYKSKGVNPWVKGQISLLNTTKQSLASANTNLFTCVVESGGTQYLYVADGGVVRFSSNPFDASPTWTAITTGSPTTLPTTAITGLETNGQNVYIAWTGKDIWYTTPGSTTATFFYPTSGTDSQTYNAFGFAKGRGFAAVNQDLYQIGVGSGSHTIFFDNPDTTFRWAGAAPGQNAVYAAGYAGNKSLIYKITIKADGTLDVPVVSLELPAGEIVSAIHGYLGFIVIGSNKGVRFCNTDAQSNLVAGSLIPTSGAVNDFTSEEKFVWFTYSNYDGTSTGLGRLDLSVFISPNTPAHATDLMYTSTSDVKSVSTISGKRIFTISGVGVIVEDTTTVVPSGEIEFGTYRWGIPDRKFVAKFDVRTEPLLGSVAAYLSNDHSSYTALGTFSSQSGIEFTYQGTDTKTIEADFKLVLTRGTVDTDDSPIVTRWMARAYAAPFRSEVFSIPLLLHAKIRPRDRDIYLNPEQELDNLNSLIHNPRIVTLQLGTSSYSVITEDVEWQPIDSTGNTWSWDGTATVTMRSVEN